MILVVLEVLLTLEGLSFLKREGDVLQVSGEVLGHL